VVVPQTCQGAVPADYDDDERPCGIYAKNRHSARERISVIIFWKIGRALLFTHCRLTNGRAAGTDERDEHSSCQYQLVDDAASSGMRIFYTWVYVLSRCHARHSSVAVFTIVAAVLLALTNMMASIATAATITVMAQRRGDTIDLAARAELAADRETAWRILTDYERYTEFIPNLRLSRIVAVQGPTITVEQSGDAQFWLLHVPLDVTYEVTEIPPNIIQSRAIRGSVRAFTSTYVLTAHEHGVTLDYTGSVAPGYELLGRIEEIAVRRTVEKQFRALAVEIERRARAAVVK
jgi:Polyketide cyclase / dehydrase and lipid transport